MKRLSIVGSTGSIGTQTLDVVRSAPELFEVESLVARRSWKLLADQALEFRPKWVVLLEEEHYQELREALSGTPVEVHCGVQAAMQAASLPAVDTTVSALVGMAGLRPTLAAIESGKELALANKESLVVSGELMLEASRASGTKILPVDSEHSAIFQCLQNQAAAQKIFLTASGGPFRKRPASELHYLTAAQALQHPTWNMGAKITIDSASLMNKGFEVIEAHYLFGLDYDLIEVWVHPQSIIHSMVEFCDGSVLAQLGPPDMRTPISYALHYPARRGPAFTPLTLNHMRELTFEAPRREDFPCLNLAFAAGRKRGTSPAVLNAANEVAVEAFLANRISFGAIPELITKCLEKHESDGWRSKPTLEDLIEVDRWARAYTAGYTQSEVTP